MELKDKDISASGKLSILADKSKACDDEVRKLEAQEGKTVFNYVAVMVQKIRKMVIEEIINDFKEH